MNLGGVAPGPRGHWLAGNLGAFRGDELGLISESTRRYGDIVRFRLGPTVVHLLNHPDHIEHVMVRQAGNYLRLGRSARFLREVCGHSLLTTDGADWRELRRLMQPIFQAPQVAVLAGVMTEATAELIARWEKSSGGEIEVVREMSQLAFVIAGRAMFGEELKSEAERIERALAEVLAQAFARVQSIVSLPRWLPTATNRKFKAALKEIDRVVLGIVEARRRRPSTRLDLLALLLAGQLGQAELSDRALRNECVTLLLAGHETTANALSWTLFLLATHPEAQARVQEEARTVLGEREPTIEDAARLSFTGAVLQESMRLYPPIWIVERRVVSEDVIGGFRIPAGSMVIVSPWALHRHPIFWSEPDQFRPDRFSETWDRRAFIPFGLGPHNCIGQHFASLEVKLVLAMVARRFQWSLAPGQSVTPQGGITLRPKEGVRLKIA